MLAQRMSNRQQRMLEVLRRLMLHTEALQLSEVLAFTVPANLASQGLMQRLGMQHQVEQDFQHPLLPVGHPLRQHVLYRLTQASWRMQRKIALPTGR